MTLPLFWKGKRSACVCVCVRERESERESTRARETESKKENEREQSVRVSESVIQREECLSCSLKENEYLCVYEKRRVFNV